MYNFKIFKEINSNEWNENLKKCDYSTFFQTAEFLIYESEGYGSPLFIYVFDESNIVQAQLGLIILNSASRFSSGLFLGSITNFFGLATRAMWTSGPIIHTRNKKSRIEILDVIIEAMESIAESYNLVLIGGYSPPQDLQVDEEYKIEFKKNKYEIINLHTYTTDLTQSIDEIWDGVLKKPKGDVTRAFRKNIVVKEVENNNDLKEYAVLLKKWRESKGAEIKDPLKFVERYWNYYKTMESGRIFLAYEEGELISGLRVGCFNGIVYTQEVINNYEKPSNLGGTLLTWHAVQWAKNSKMRVYDFSGISDGPENVKKNQNQNKKWLSLEFYKSKWGGKKFMYYQFLKIRKKKKYRLFKILTRPYWVYRNFRMKRYKRYKKN